MSELVVADNKLGDTQRPVPGLKLTREQVILHKHDLVRRGSSISDATTEAIISSPFRRTRPEQRRKSFG